MLNFIDYIGKIVSNVFNNTESTVSQVAETSLGSTVISIIVIIIVGMLLTVAVFIFASLLQVIFLATKTNMGMLAAIFVGTIYIAASSGALEWFRVLLVILLLLCCIGGIIGTFMLNKQHGLAASEEKMRMFNVTTLGMFIVGIFIISPNLYALLPFKLNEWCIFTCIFFLACSAANEPMKNLRGDD